MARPILLIGTGTAVGKTHVAERLLRALAAEGMPALGYKPVESGVVGGEADTDIARLRAASTFHVKPELVSYTFEEPVSPHLAARLAQRSIDLPLLKREIDRGAALAEALVVELPGGAFSPLTDEVAGADLARSVVGARVILVASDRLGVLHEIGATTRACAAMGLPLLGLVLDAPAATDASTGRNAGELHRVTAVPLLCELSRGAADAPVPATDPARSLARYLSH